MIVRVHAVVKNVDGKTVTLALDDAQELHVAYSDSTPIQIGEECTLTIQTKAEAELGVAELSRTILNSIITDEKVQNPPKAETENQ